MDGEQQATAGNQAPAAVWVLSGPALPCGARPLGESGPGRVWVDVCILGQHLPQSYQGTEIHPLDADRCARLGLCPDCLGFGDLNPVPAAGMLAAARGIDEVDRPCPNCGGTGRPALRITLTRDTAGVAGSIRPLPHSYVPPLGGADPVMLAAFQIPEGFCLACGMPSDGTGPRGEALHTPAEAATL
jgi:hypothetical protein